MSRSEIGASEERMFFAAANSGRGFVSFYGEVFDRPEIRRRYIIKGGPGTGKSGFMRRVARAAELAGHGVRCYRCASDPDSLDAVVVDGTLAVLDGTAPHTVEPRAVGARDEIVNLGAFWDGEALARHYEEIEALDREKSRCYRRAYRYLSASTDLWEINHALILPYLRPVKMRASVGRLLSEIPEGKGFDLLPTLQSAIGMRGRVRSESYRSEAKRVYAVEDFLGMGWLLLSEVIDLMRRKNQPLLVSYHPLVPDRPDAVLLRESGICFLLRSGEGEESDGRIRMRRFLDPAIPSEVKVEYRTNRRISDGLVEGAREALHKAGEAHGALEQIYGSCMDFLRLDGFTRGFCVRLFGSDGDPSSQLG